MKSKVASSINGRKTVKSYCGKRRKRLRRKAKSLPRLKIKRTKSVRTKSVRIKKRRKRKRHSKILKKGPKTEVISESMYSIKPLNIRTEVAVKLFPDKNKKITDIGSNWTKPTTKNRYSSK